MGLRYEEKWTVPFDMCDVKQEIKVASFISHCLAVSGRQSEELGRSDLFVYREYGLIWVVTDYDVTINRLPKYNETITIQTEALAYNKYFCHRIFSVYDQENNHLMDILCYFVLIDFESRKVAPVPSQLIAPYQAEEVKKLPRIPKYAELSNPIELEFLIRYFDIDMNGHVNNAKYLEWMYETLGYDFLLSHYPRKIQLRYIKEVGANSRIHSKFERHDLQSRHEIIVEGHVHAQAVIEWEKTKE